MKRSVPILIIGPSGVGKNAVIDRVLQIFPELQSFQTTTSRQPRPGEHKYHYVTREAFQRLIDAGSFLEWEETHGQLYGTQRRHIEEVMETGKFPVPISAVDYRGALSYQRAYPGTLVIFLAFESLDDLPERLRRTRPGITEDEIRTRLETAREEMTHLNEFDHVVINREGKLEESVEQVAKILGNVLGFQRNLSIDSTGSQKARSGQKGTV